MNAVNSKENVEKEGLSKNVPSIVIIWDAQNRHIRCVVDRQNGIRYINELAKKDAVTVLIN